MGQRGGSLELFGRANLASVAFLMRKRQVWNPFKKLRKTAADSKLRFETIQIAECLDLIGHANANIQRDILRRLSRAISFLSKEFRLPNDATFAELKRSLRSDQASAIGIKVRQMGSAIADNTRVRNRDDVALDEMIFMLIGASLSARSGLRTISPEHEQSIDKMIAIAEEADPRARID
jgi:hypothetical protein